MKKPLVLLTCLPVIIFAQPVFERPIWNYSNPPVFAESLHSYDVRHYRLDLDLPMTNAGYLCHERIEIKSNQTNLDTLPLDFAGLVCDSVLRQGTSLTFDTPPGLLRIYLDTPLPLGESTTIDIFFHREPNAPQIGYFFAQPPTIPYAHAMTCGCPRDNHYWFPCWDLPNDKADKGCAINITLPDTFQACANGLLDSVTDAPGGKKTWWWRHPYPICTYLMTFSASRFARWDTIVTCPNGETVPLIYFMWPRDSAATRTGFRLVPDMMLYYSDTSRFGPYPFERFGMVPGYYGFPWGGMEHQTQVMIHTSYLGGGGEGTICHELSHMWWGDMVTHVGYADVWLNEGFASWAECLYMGHLNGRNYFQNYIAGKARQYFSQHRTRDFPIYNPPWSEIYNYGIIYCKGSWILRMLQFLCGDTAWQTPGVFFRALRTYADSLKYGTASTEDFQRITEQVTGLDLDQFFAEWVYDRGYPKFRLNWAKNQVGDSWQIILRLAQDNDTNSRAIFTTPFPVRFNCTSESITITLYPQDTLLIDTINFAEEVIGLNPDPDNWILDSTYVTQVGIAELASPFHSVVKIQPNPGKSHISFHLEGQRIERLKILDRAGREVSLIRPETNVFVWDRTDINGRRLPAGVYFVILSGKDPQPLTKLMLLD
ncbi:MAG: M1 family aminopeptidase [candidate division WOR-3 bacterium]